MFDRLLTGWGLWVSRAMGLVVAVLIGTMVGLSVVSAQDVTVDTEPDVAGAVENDGEASDVESSEDISADLGEDLSKNSPYEQWQYLATIVVPWLVAVAVRRGMSKEGQTVLMVIISAVFAVVASYLRGEFDNFQYSATAVLQLVISVQVAYQVMSRIPGVGDLLRMVEEKTGGDDADSAKARKMQPVRPPG